MTGKKSKYCSSLLMSLNRLLQHTGVSSKCQIFSVVSLDSVLSKAFHVKYYYHLSSISSVGKLFRAVICFIMIKLQRVPNGYKKRDPFLFIFLIAYLIVFCLVPQLSLYWTKLLIQLSNVVENVSLKNILVWCVHT